MTRLDEEAALGLRDLCLRELKMRPLNDGQRMAVAAAIGAVWVLEPWKAVPLLEAMALLMGIDEKRIEANIDCARAGVRIER